MKIGTAQEWREARVALLEKEKALVAANKAMLAERRQLPVVPVTKDYQFEGPNGPLSLKDLFGSASQLIVYHYMFEPDWEDGCTGCAFIAANFPDLRHLAERETNLAVISRAPIDKITTWKNKNLWKFQWVSSLGSDFNYDYHATLDEQVAPVEYNFKTKAEMEASGRKGPWKGEMPGLSVFKLEDGQVYHTYSNYANIDELTATNAWLDLTPHGRDEGPRGDAVFKTPGEYAQEEKAEAEN